VLLSVIQKQQVSQTECVLNCEKINTFTMKKPL